jgi:hypothetical protein
MISSPVYEEQRSSNGAYGAALGGGNLLANLKGNAAPASPTGFTPRPKQQRTDADPERFTLSPIPQPQFQQQPQQPSQQQQQFQFQQHQQFQQYLSQQQQFQQQQQQATMPPGQMQTQILQQAQSILLLQQQYDALSGRLGGLEQQVLQVKQQGEKQSVEMNSGFAAIMERLNTNAQASSSTPWQQSSTYPQDDAKAAGLMVYNFQELENENEDKLHNAMHQLIFKHLSPRAINHMNDRERSQQIANILRSVRRVGNAPSGNKPRPICIRFDSYQHKMDVFVMAPKLKGTGYEHISLDSDLTREQQEQRQAQKPQREQAVLENKRTTWDRWNPTKLIIFSGGAANAPPAGKPPSAPSMSE